MQFDEVLIFDIESEYGHFRKYNTTTSPLTYSIPTRPAIAGFMGSILGVERELSAGNFAEGATPVADLFSKEQAGIAVQIMRPIKKVNIAFNLLDTEKTGSSFFNIKQRTQIEFELLKNPSFRIYAAFADKALFSELSARIKEKRFHFSPYLGLSQFTATVHYRGAETIALLNTGESEEVITAVNLNLADPDDPVQFDYSGDFKYTSDTLPIAMQKDRTVTEYAEVIVETNGHGIRIKSQYIATVKDQGNILFL